MNITSDHYLIMNQLQSLDIKYSLLLAQLSSAIDADISNINSQI